LTPPWRSTPKMAASKIRSRANRNLAGGFLRSLNPLFTCDYWASKSPTSFGSSLCARNRRSRGLKPERCGSPFLFDRVKEPGSPLVMATKAVMPTVSASIFSALRHSASRSQPVMSRRRRVAAPAGAPARRRCRLSLAVAARPGEGRPTERRPAVRPLAAGTTLHVKGFGCRPVVTYPRVLRAGVRKPPGKEPAVGGAGGGRLWRFDGRAAWASDALSDGVGGGSTIATVAALPVLFSTG
jgi:hypothetical protein